MSNIRPHPCFRNVPGVTRMSRLSVLFLVVVLVFSRYARAADQQFAVAGPGVISCGKWIEARAFQNKDIDNVFTAWIQGFLSGMNTWRWLQTKQEMSLIPDPPSVLAYVDKFCRENPLEGVYSASMQLYRDMQKP